MAKTNRKRPRRPLADRATAAAPVETRASEALTVFWVVSVLTVLVADLVMVAAHFYLRANPAAVKMSQLQGLLLLTGFLVGVVSLVTLPILYRVRKVPPPLGLAVFGACVAAAPILAVLARAFH